MKFIQKGKAKSRDKEPYDACPERDDTYERCRNAK